jgi:hypothetical protein
MSTITIQVPDYVRHQVERLAAEDGISVDQFFTTAASEKLSEMEAGDYISTRATRANDAAFEAALEHIPNIPVTDSSDELP